MTYCPDKEQSDNWSGLMFFFFVLMFPHLKLNMDIRFYNNERSGILIFCYESLTQVCQIKKSSKNLLTAI